MISPNALPDCFCWLQEAKQTQGLSALIRVTAFNSYQKLIKNHKLIKIQPQNPNQTSASKAWPNLSLKVLTKDIQNTKYKIYKIYKNISWPNFSFNIINTIKVQNLYQTSTSKSRPNCTFLSINISNTNNIKKFWVGIFKGQGHISQVYYTAVTDIHLALFSTFIQKVLLGKCYWSTFALFFTWGYFFEKNGMTSRTSSRGYI